ncbi:MAG TPA: hypothetical protein VEC19_06310 [Usitatibacter sp.]|nr:hypothetical protein [Usitatibacter sp.]
MNTHNNAPEDPYRMSFAELAVQLSITQTGSSRAAFLERELRRRLASEQAGLMRYQLAIGVVAGGLIALASFYMGAAVARVVPPHQHRAEAGATGMAERAEPRIFLPDLRRN